MTPGRRRWTLGLVVAFAVAGAVLVAHQSPLSRRTADFTIGYSVGELIRSGRADAVYDQEQLGAVMQRAAPGVPVDPRLPFNEPLAAGLVYVPLSLLPIDVAFRAWQVISVLIMLLAVVCLQRQARLGARAPAVAWVALLGSVPAWATLTEGQLTPLLLLGAVFVVSAGLGGSARFAAGGAALLAIKPQYLPAYLILLLAWRRWRCLYAALIGAATVVLSPIVAGGAPALSALVHNAYAGDRLVSLRLTEGWIGSLAPIIPDRFTSLVALVLFALATAGLLVVGYRSGAPRAALAALAGWLAILGSPHSLPHDLVLLAVPAWFAFVLYEKRWLPSPIIGLLLIDAGLVLDLHGFAVTIGPLVMTAVVAWYWWAFRRRAKQQTHPLPAAA